MPDYFCLAKREKQFEKLGYFGSLFIETRPYVPVHPAVLPNVSAPTSELNSDSSIRTERMSSTGTRMAPGRTKVVTSYQRHIVFPQRVQDVQDIDREHKWKLS